MTTKMQVSFVYDSVWLILSSVWTSWLKCSGMFLLAQINHSWWIVMWQSIYRGRFSHRFFFFYLLFVAFVRCVQMLCMTTINLLQMFIVIISTIINHNCAHNRALDALIQMFFTNTFYCDPFVHQSNFDELRITSLYTCALNEYVHLIKRFQLNCAQCTF